MITQISTITIAAVPAVVAAEQSGGTDLVSILTGLGPVGVILVLFIFGKLRTENEVKQRDEIIKQRDDTIKAKDDQIVALYTSLANASTLLEKNTDVLERFIKSSGGP